MKVRQATMNDYLVVMQLYNDFVGEDRYSRHDNDSFETVLDDPLSRVFVAEDNGKVIGFATVSTKDIVRAPRPIAELDELFVDPASRTHGTGTALMEAVESFARSRNCYRLYMVSAYERETAHKFYEHLGYKNNGYHFQKDL